jgi:hypothetical protein
VGRIALPGGFLGALLVANIEVLFLVYCYSFSLYTTKSDTMQSSLISQGRPVAATKEVEQGETGESSSSLLMLT